MFNLKILYIIEIENLRLSKRKRIFYNPLAFCEKCSSLKIPKSKFANRYTTEVKIKDVGK